MSTEFVDIALLMFKAHHCFLNTFTRDHVFSVAFQHHHVQIEHALDFAFYFHGSPGKVREGASDQIFSNFRRKAQLLHPPRTNRAS